MKSGVAFRPRSFTFPQRMDLWPQVRKSLKYVRLSARVGFTTALILGATIYLSAESRKSERQLLEAETARAADSAAAQLQDFMAARISGLEDLADFVASTPPDAVPAAFAPFASRLMTGAPNFQGVWRIDGSGVVTLAVAAPGMPPSRSPTASTIGPAIHKAAVSGEPAGTVSFELNPSEQGMAVVVPVFRHDLPDGFVAGTVRLSHAIEGIYGPDVLDFWHLGISDRTGHRVFRSDPADGNPAPNGALVERHVPMADVAWKIRMWPKESLIATLGTTSPNRILAIGLVAALITAVANYLLAQRQRRLSASLRESERLTEAVEATRRHLTDLVNGIEAVIWESDAEMHRFTFVNDYARKLLGLDTGRWVAEPAFWYENVHPDDRARARENASAARQPGHTYPIEYRMVDAAGQILWVREIITVISDHSRVLGRRGVVVDITPRVHAEEALRQSQKLESLGVLAGGIAHDFNNLLTTILGNAEMLSPLLAGQGSAGRMHLDKIERTTRRLAELTRQMLAYSGRTQFSVAEVNLNALLREMGELLSVSVTKNVRVVYELEANLPPLEGDSAQIRQVILNLLTNASEAIGDNGRGEVIVRTESCVLGNSGAANLFPGQDLEPGRYIRLEVSDNGCGMTPETLSKIFDPFFSTKFTGRGLGLAALQGIVRGHRGGIKIFSQPGEGTVFTLLFPAGRRRIREPAPEAHASPPSDIAGTCVLLVDDEEGLRSLMAEALEAAGCTVFQAADGEAGVEEFRAHAFEIDVTLLDLTMPKLNGEEVFQQIVDTRPDACVILCSGYTEEDVVRQFAGQRLAGFLEKPFRPSDLVEKIRRALDVQRIARVS
jgi:PAS domain S-box-containing protein